MSSCFTRARLAWRADFLPPGELDVQLGAEHQDAPELLAFVAWLKEVQRAAAAVATNTGDPFTGT